MSQSEMLFSQFDFPSEIAQALIDNQLVKPTPVQEQALPHLLDGQDVLATAQTGTGKTLAFALPIVTQLLKNPEARALVLVPTRELAQQVLKTFHMLTKKTRGLKTALLIGGAFMRAQCQDLSKNPRIIVGTPGRIIDHLMRRTLDPQNIRHVVLDEMDRMLDMGFGEQLSEIFGYLEGQPRQTAMFSATLPGHITKLAGRYLNSNPVKISIGQHSQPVARIKQEVVFIKQSEKAAKLVNILVERAEKAEPGSCIIFVKTKMDCDVLAQDLQDQGFEASAMHGDLNQSKRQRVLQNFRTQKVNILVATDIAARGIDVAHVRLVINYELPQAAEDYIHRIGRTARGGAEGTSISFVAPFEQKKWVEILRLTNPEEAKAFQQQMGSRHSAGKSSSSRFEQRRHGSSSRSSFGNKERSFGGPSRFTSNEQGGEQRSSFGRSSNGQRPASRWGNGEANGSERRYGEERKSFGWKKGPSSDREGSFSERSGFSSDRPRFSDQGASEKRRFGSDSRSFGQRSERGSSEGRARAPKQSFSVRDGHVYK